MFRYCFLGWWFTESFATNTVSHSQPCLFITRIFLSAFTVPTSFSPSCSSFLQNHFWLSLWPPWSLPIAQTLMLTQSDHHPRSSLSDSSLPNVPLLCALFYSTLFWKHLWGSPTCTILFQSPLDKTTRTDSLPSPFEPVKIPFTKPRRSLPICSWTKYNNPISKFKVF